ncbi:TPA: LemA family protein [Candidatus Woesearchaeota archaeon]|nr:LemA family protein [Candidatus Woesearchaeota archaeon]
MVVGIIIVILVILGLIILGLVVYVIGLYNSLVSLKNNIKKAWSNIDVLLTQRSDELTKLVSTVKGYMKHESKTFTEIAKARSALLSAKTMGEKASADNMITGALKTLFAVAENYPTLKANENFNQLQTRITDIENELADRREFYNDSVNTYNIKIQTFPTLFFARMLNYGPEELFSATAEEKKDVKIEF